MDKQGGRNLIFSLCMADLRHEWLLTLCMVLAVAAVLGPLLILFGLKHGTVETMRNRLIRDPRNCEIRPLNTFSYDEARLAAMAKEPDVAFVIPVTRQLASSVDLARQGGKMVAVDLIPTGEGDPLLLENGALIPGERQGVLTEPAAEALGAAVGEMLTLTARRVRGSGIEKSEISLVVTGILPLRGGATKALFVPLPLLEAVENYKDGMAVPRYGWPGTLPRAYPAFSGLLLASAAPLGPELEFRVGNNTGFTSVASIPAREAQEFLGPGASSGPHFYLLATQGSLAGTANLFSVNNLLKGKKVSLYPLVREAVLTIADQSGQTLLQASLQPATALDSAPPGGIADSPPWRENFTSSPPPPSAQWRQLLVPLHTLDREEEGYASLTGEGGQTLRFPVRLIPSALAKPGTAKAPLRLLGVLGLAGSRPVRWSGDGEEFLLEKRGYAGFRLYAAGIEKVSGLRKRFEEQGIIVHTEAQRIDDVLRLDTYLSLIFWLIAVGSLLGGAACLVANIYAGIERKRKDLAVLRLLGISGQRFLLFPVFTSAFYALAGFTLAVVLFFIMAMVINGLFGEHMQEGESLCRLAWWHYPTSLAITLAIALCAAAVAAGRAASVDPAEALRNE